MIHALADCQTKKIGENTRIWQFCVILPEAEIGDYCNICAHVLIENKVKIGNHCTIKSGVQLWDGVTLEDNVFVGPNVTFTNDTVPRSGNKDFTVLPTTIKSGASIGANATIMAGITIGECAFVGAGSVVTKDVPAYTVVYGTPARIAGTITKEGMISKLIEKQQL